VTKPKRDRRLGQGLAALLGGTMAGNSNDPADSSQIVSNPFASPPDEMPDEGAGHTEPEVEADRVEPAGSTDAGEDQDRILHLSLDQIDPNPFQPRRDFRQEEIESLAASLDSHQMLQPILVRSMNGRFQLISGERRLRAATHAGWSSIPAQVREADDRLVAELAIVENLQRKDLNPIEKAMSFKRYIEQHQCKQDELAKRLKIDRSTVANLMRLLELPKGVLDALSSEKISAGHARALLPLGEEEEQIAFSDRIQSEGLSVRETERLVKELVQQEDKDDRSKSRRDRGRNQQLASLEQELRNALGTKVWIKKKGAEKGQIVIHFENSAEFDRLRDLVTGQKKDEFAA